MMDKMTFIAVLIAGTFVAASASQAAPVLQPMKAKGCGTYIREAAQPENTNRFLAFVDDEGEHIFVKIKGQRQVLDFISRNEQVSENSEFQETRIYENPDIHVELRLTSTRLCGRDPSGVQDKGCESVSAGTMAVQTPQGVASYKIQTRNHC